ncbi:MAG: alpha/beta fold hydrolase, partial [Gemmatimonadaceae bacterium]
ESARISAPTLVVTGEPALDHVVPAAGSSEYGRLIRNARTVVRARTGHLGSVTRPDEFAALVAEFCGEVLK